MLVDSDILTADGLAVDWIHDLVYWTDTGKNVIAVANVKRGTDRTVLIDTDLDEPRAIVVNVVESFLVWSDWGDKPKIERSAQDGSNRVSLVKDNIIWPNGLSIDYVTKNIYWLDAKLYTLNSVDYKGNDRQMILKSAQFIKHPFALDVFEDFVYWSDWELESIMRTSKFGSVNGTVEHVVNGVFSVMDVRVLHPYMQPAASSRCQLAKCSHLCLPNVSSFRCACPANHTLESDGYSCSGLEPTSTAPTPTSKPTTLIVVIDPETEHKGSLLPASTDSRDTLPSEHSAHSEHGQHGQPHAPVGPDVTLEQAAASGENESDGHFVLIIAAVLTTLSVFVAILSLIIYRNYQR